MRRWLGMLVLCACAGAPLHAQEAGSPEALQAAQELSAMVTTEMVGQLSHNMISQMWPRIEAEFGGKVDAATLAELRGEVESAVTSFTTDAMKDVPAVYAKYFTAQELRDLLTFYKTPTGSKALKTLPQVTADITSRMVPQLQSFQSDLLHRLRAVMDKHGYKN
jgi:uncharacterized protein